MQVDTAARGSIKELEERFSLKGAGFDEKAQITREEFNHILKYIDELEEEVEQYAMTIAGEDW